MDGHELSGGHAARGLSGGDTGFVGAAAAATGKSWERGGNGNAGRIWRRWRRRRSNKYFWLEERGYFVDQLVAKPGQSAAQGVVDNSLRSNCLMAVSLGFVSGEPARRCVEAAIRYLVVPGALRTLAPLPVSPPLPIYGNSGQLLNNPVEPYWGHYEGDEDTRRKPAYHNGTAWTWTFPIFCEALAKAWEGSPEALAAARAYLGSMDRLLMGGCTGPDSRKSWMATRRTRNVVAMHRPGA